MMIWDVFPVLRFLCGHKSGMPGIIYNNVCSPPRVRILENPHFFWKKVSVKFAGKQKRAYLCTRNRENNRLLEEERSLKGLHKTRQHKEA